MEKIFLLIIGVLRKLSKENQIGNIALVVVPLMGRRKQSSRCCMAVFGSSTDFFHF